MENMWDEIGEVLVKLGRIPVYDPEKTHLTYSPDYGVVSLCLNCATGKGHGRPSKPGHKVITKQIDSVEELLADEEIDLPAR